ncbi:hypothetical protein BpHYR1_022516 [Brachionus plicatilis]|uniref:Uncharacterized protein n=1 Tax=Brachionus plicatilis TaxID=10195 RepID=A0A3M7R4I0_BRAPC|nr:hypothetical protein BpHYR1_022516 [Brachionus plicatilis]
MSYGSRILFLEKITKKLDFSIFVSINYAKFFHLGIYGIFAPLPLHNEFRRSQSQQVFEECTIDQDSDEILDRNTLKNYL